MENDEKLEIPTIAFTPVTLLSPTGSCATNSNQTDSDGKPEILGVVNPVNPQPL